LAILCNIHSFAFFFLSEVFSVFIVSNFRSVLAQILVLAGASCLITTFSPRVSRVVFDSPQATTSQAQQKLVSALAPCGMIEIMSHATLGESA
jgi:hypothetical protein